jgi:hypothetical protein
MFVDLWDLRTGDVLDLASGGRASVLSPTEDGEWILIRYLASRRLELVAQSDLVNAAEVVGLISSARN